MFFTFLGPQKASIHQVHVRRDRAIKDRAEQQPSANLAIGFKSIACWTMSQSEKPPPPPCVNMRRIAVNFIGSAGFNSPARNKKTDQVINDEMVAAATAATVLSSHCWPAVRPIDQSRLRH